MFFYIVTVVLKVENQNWYFNIITSSILIIKQFKANIQSMHLKIQTMYIQFILFNISNGSNHIHLHISENMNVGFFYLSDVDNW